MKKKKQITDIQLAFPCTQQWENMTVCDNGRFCSGCQKAVFDFTSKNQEDYALLYAKHNGQLCGRFTLNQLKTSNSLGKAALFAGMLLSTELDAQTDSVSISPIIPIDTIKPSIHEEVFIGIILEPQPEFEGGFVALYKFISENLRYPDQNCVAGTVYVGFIVDTDGNLKNIEVKRGLANLPQYGEEAVRVIKLTSGKWKSGLKKEPPVETRFTLPIRFKLD
jgi:TonB family protein